MIRKARDTAIIFQTHLTICCLLSVGLFSLFPGCTHGTGMDQISEYTVKGPEAPDLVGKLTGYIVMDRPVGGMVALALPTLQEQTIRPTNENAPGVVQALSGPDTQGRIAYIENFMMQKQHQMKVIGLDGTHDQVLFTRPGDALWDHVISEHIALSPRNGKLAFASALNGAQMRNPDALLQEGMLEIWDIQKGTGQKLRGMALDDGFSWFPDGKRLAFVALVPRAQIPSLSIGSDKFGASFTNWERVPAVHILDTTTGKATYFHVGWHPVVASDGQALLVTDFDNNVHLVQTASRDSRSIDIPGLWGEVLLYQAGRVLYWGFPTEGAKQKFTEHNSPISGPKLMMTLKVVEIKTGKIQTVVPYIDPRQKASFGVVQP